jgi:hypothetical protein
MIFKVVVESQILPISYRVYFKVFNRPNVENRVKNKLCEGGNRQTRSAGTGQGFICFFHGLRSRSALMIINK